MLRWIALPLLMMSLVTASSAKKVKGTTTVKDLLTAGTTDTKYKKKQQYDFVFEASGNRYTCRTGPKTSLKATDFIVGSDVKYELDEDKAKLKSTNGKEAKCVVVRVEKASSSQP